MTGDVGGVEGGRGAVTIGFDKSLHYFRSCLSLVPCVRGIGRNSSLVVFILNSASLFVHLTIPKRKQATKYMLQGSTIFCKANYYNMK